MCVCVCREGGMEEERTVVEISEKCNAANFEDKGRVL